MEGSIVIRTINEKERLSELLDALAGQEFEGSQELIVVDNDSADGTPELAQEKGARVVNIPRDTFSYPKSMNLGVAAAHSEIIVLTVGHALPVGRRWLAKGVRHFNDPKVAGVFSPVLARKDGTLAETIFYGFGYLGALLTGPKTVRYRGMGIMGATNCVLRKSLWEKHNFDERYELGGEDGEWAAWALAHGYKIICEPGFVVRHSHGNGWKELKKQREYWKKLGGPTKFSREALSFRKDIRW